MALIAHPEGVSIFYKPLTLVIVSLVSAAVLKLSQSNYMTDHNEGKRVISHSGLGTKRGNVTRENVSWLPSAEKIRWAREKEDAKRGKPCNGWQGRVQPRNLIKDGCI